MPLMNDVKVEKQLLHTLNLQANKQLIFNNHALASKCHL